MLDLTGSKHIINYIDKWCSRGFQVFHCSQSPDVFHNFRI